MAFKASFKFSDSREFDVLNWRVKFNRDVDPKGRPAYEFLKAQEDARQVYITETF